MINSKMNVIEKLEEQKITKCPNCDCQTFFMEDFNAEISIVSYMLGEEYKLWGEPQKLPKIRISCNNCDTVIYEGN